MENILKQIKKHWLILWICLALLGLGILSASAAYTKLSSVKRVVTTRKGVGMLFSSNYMQEGGTLKNVVFTSENSDPVVKVTVCNFSQTDKTRHYDKQINYTLTAELVDSNGESLTGTITGDYSIDSTSIEVGSIVEQSNQILDYTKSYYNEHTLRFDKSQFNEQNVFIKVTATPNSSDLKAISATIGVSLRLEKTPEWTGTFTDNATSPTALDGFNYRLSGSGEGTVTLTWNTNYVDISPWFKSTYNLEVSTDTTTKISTATLKVDSAEKNQYDIQFYRTNGINENEVWSDNNHTNITVNDTGFVSMTFTQSSDTATD